MHDHFGFWILYAAFCTVYNLGHISIWPLIRPSGEAPFFSAALPIEYEFNALAGSVRLIFRDGKHNVNLQAAVRRSGIVVLHGGLPGNIVCFQNLLDFVILPDVAKPPIQLNEQYPVDFPCLDVCEKLLHDLPLQSRLSSAVAFIPINADYFVSVIMSVLREHFLLRLQAVAS